MKVIQIAKTVEEAVEKGLRDLGLSRDEVDIVVLEEPKAGFLGLFGRKDAVVEISAKDSLVDEDLDVLSRVEKQIQVHEEKEDRLEELEEIRKEKKRAEERKDFLEKEKKKVEKPVEKEEKTVVKEEKPVEKEIRKERVVTTEKVEESEKVESEKTFESISDEEFSKIRQEANNFLMKLLYEMGLPSSIDYREDGQNIYFKIIPENSKDTGIIIGKRGETLDSIQYLVNLVTNRHSDTYIRVILDVNNYRQRREESLKRLASKMARNTKRYQKTMRLEPMNPYERRIIHSHLHNDPEIETFSEGRDPHRRVVIKIK